MKSAMYSKAALLILGTFLISHFSFSQTTIFPSTTTWSYKDNNIPPAGWPTAHEATSWATGAAPLGYSNGVTTTVSFGPDPSNKYITTYFNKIISIPNASSYGSFTINLVRDDGAILYINGVEVLRSNMPNTAVSHSTFASSVVNDGAQEAQIFTYTVPPSYFVNGDNTFSLELHQVNLTSSDLSFTVEVIGNPGTANSTVINYGENWKFLDNGTDQGTAWRASAFNDASWSIGNGEFGYGDGDEVTCVASGGGGTICLPTGNKYITTYFRKAITIADPFDYINFILNVKRDDGVVIYINGVERYSNNMPAGRTYTTLASSAASDDGETPQSVTLSSALFTAGTNVIAVEMHQNVASSSDLTFDLELIGQVSMAPPPTTLISYGSPWKYLDIDTRPANWETTGFVDNSWAEGPSELGYGDGDEATCVASGGGNTICMPTGNKFITTYFRKTITITNPSAYTDFTLNVKRDDGVVIYINGVERYSNNMPAGRLHSTLAIAAIGGVDESTPQTTTLSSAFFTAGTNVIAVEMHQNAASSSDLTFDLELIGNAVPVGLITFGDIWKYLDDNTRPANWETTGFTDDSWAEGPSELGYGDGDEATCVASGGGGTICTPTGNKYTTTYFRKTFDVTGLSGYNNFTLNIVRDDGVVVYLNGIEVARDNMPAGTPSHSTFASSVIGDAGESTPISFSLSTCSFAEGTNTIAVEIHQSDLTSSDISFNIELLGNPGNGGGGTPTLTRQPYLQMGNQTAITVRWRTDIPSLGRVEVGPSFGNYTTITADETCARTEHEVRVTGLNPDTKYFYRIGTTDNLVLQATNTNFFTTTPPENTTRKIRVAAFGDCGRNNSTYQDANLTNYQNYLATNGIDAPDAWILMGDNAYNSGTDGEFTSNFFNIYGNGILRNHKLYPAPGNHDYGNNAANKTLRNLPYHTIFTTPAAGECGGVPSAAENFYSYDIGNIHFLSLDSWGIEADGSYMGRDTNLVHTQLSWIKNDLAANTKKWVVAYWHHPPYTKGSHDSDGEGELVNVRQLFIKTLEDRGVDLIITGHSHNYERSYLLKGHFGNEASFNLGTHAVSSSSAAYTSNTTCPYVYNSAPVNHGTVYVVAGSSGASGGQQTGYPHNALPFAYNNAGIFYFEVEDNRLDGKFLRGIPPVGAPDVPDQFTIIKDVNKTTNYTIGNGGSQTLTASWPGVYNWTPGGASTRSINVTPPNNTTTNYTVTDAFGCITDQFSVTTTSALPVSLLSYDAKLNINKVEVTWSTATENNNAYFSVERSADGINFSPLKTVNGAGNSSATRQYSFIDLSPLFGVSYYRLSQTDFDGNKKYLGTKRIVYNPGKDFEVKVVSTNNKMLALQINAVNQGDFHLRIFDLLGREWKNERLNLGTGITRKEILLNSGVYIWEIRNDKAEFVRQKVIIQ